MNTISERRKAQLAEKKKLTEKIKQVEEETNQCKLREIELVAGAMHLAAVRVLAHKGS